MTEKSISTAALDSAMIIAVGTGYLYFISIISFGSYKNQFGISGMFEYSHAVLAKFGALSILSVALWIVSMLIAYIILLELKYFKNQKN